ncbi:unnamed protein product [Bursaphelenchus okinawaensis]|uniref:Uncharacterized protein n=1 Tax=Bursaphelenchus okinawaensis TaxID=465554 RepID=A0A811LPW7_9BILA|nr:unnamed protein product [Bursaphelenchus okinawaensis]CAG9127202.1 unnamed protein product [Bursaphelenchus okinawaensis]
MLASLLSRHRCRSPSKFGACLGRMWGKIPAASRRAPLTSPTTPKSAEMSLVDLGGGNGEAKGRQAHRAQAAHAQLFG